MTLEGKTVLLGVTGSIAAYKIAYLASALKKRHADVHVLMTENATNFINPITFETLTGNKCLVDTNQVHTCRRKNRPHRNAQQCYHRQFFVRVLQNYLVRP